MNPIDDKLFLHLHTYPAVTRSGHALPLKLRRGLALLAYLAIEARPVGRDGVAALLWPDAPPGVGRARLRRLVHEVNTVLGTAAIEGDNDRLALAAGVESDLARTLDAGARRASRHTPRCRRA
jgi:DNA-binding SARP family transcriptional activator